MEGCWGLPILVRNAEAQIHLCYTARIVKPLHMTSQKKSIGKIHLCPVQNMRENLCPTISDEGTTNNIEQESPTSDLWVGGNAKPSRFLWAHLLSSIKDSWRRWHAENRAVTVIQRSTLEQGPWFYPVLLHECCTAFALFVYRFAILQRRARSWTVVMWWHWFWRYSPVLV